MYRGDGLLHSASSGTLVFGTTQSAYQGGGEHIDEGYPSESVDENGIRVLYQPDDDDLVVDGHSMVLRPDALPPAEGIRYRPGTHPSDNIPLHGAAYPASVQDTDEVVLYDGAYQYDNPVFHSAPPDDTNSQVGQPYNSDTSTRPTLWS